MNYYYSIPNSKFQTPMNKIRVLLMECRVFNTYVIQNACCIKNVKIYILKLNNLQHQKRKRCFGKFEIIIKREIIQHIRGPYFLYF